jgi:hypothetical protein
VDPSAGLDALEKKKRKISCRLVYVTVLTELFRQYFVHRSVPIPAQPTLLSRRVMDTVTAKHTAKDRSPFCFGIGSADKDSCRGTVTTGSSVKTSKGNYTISVKDLVAN